MEDQTISEEKFENLIKCIEKGIETYEKVEEIVDEIKKPASNPSYLIMTINMNGPSLGSGTAEKGRRLLTAIMRSFSSAIIFCQELPGMFDPEIVPGGCESVKNESEVAVIWGTEDFDGSDEGLKTMDKDIREIREKVEGAADASELLSRITMVKLTRRQEPTESVLAVSYHEPHKSKEVDKRRFFLILLEFIGEVIEKKGIGSYIIGGDFNFDTCKWEVGDLPDKVAFQSYVLSPRSQARSGRFIPYKDNFIVYPNTKITLPWTRPLLFEREVAEDEHQEVQNTMAASAASTEGTVTAPKAADMLDHDPVVTVLVFLPPPKPKPEPKRVKDLIKNFEKNMSVSAKPKEN